MSAISERGTFNRLLNYFFPFTAERCYHTANRLLEKTLLRERDPARAAELYRKAIKIGNHVGAMHNLAILLLNGYDSVQPNPSEAKEWFDKAIESGNAESMRHLAQLLESGSKGIQKDVKEAKRLYEKAVHKKSDPDSMHRLALMLQHGNDGVERDSARAAQLYEKAVKQRANVDSMFNLAVLLRSGAKGVPRDIPRAIKLLQDAVNSAGKPHHIVMLAELLLSKDGGMKHRNPSRAKDRLEILASKKYDYAPAMTSLAALLSAGDEGVDCNWGMAECLVRQAASSGKWDYNDGDHTPWVSVEREVHDEITQALEEVLRMEYVSPQQCMLVVLGGRGTGKTSLVRNLKKLSCEGQEDAISCDATSPVTIIPGLRGLQEKELDDLVENSESLFANLTHVEDLTERVLTALQARRKLKTQSSGNAEASGSESAGGSPMPVGSSREQEGGGGKGHFVQGSGGRNLLEMRAYLRSSPSTDNPALRSANSDQLGHVIGTYPEPRFGILAPAGHFKEKLEQYLAARRKRGAAQLLGRGNAEESGSEAPDGSPRLVGSSKQRGGGGDEDMLVTDSRDSKQDLAPDIPSPSLSSKPPSPATGHAMTDRHENNIKAGPGFNTVQREEKDGRTGSYRSGTISNQSTFLSKLTDSSAGSSIPSKQYSTLKQKSPVYRRVIADTRLALCTRPFPRGLGRPVVQCWDFPVQSTYAVPHMVFIKRASIMLFVVDLSKLAIEGTKQKEIKELCSWLELGYSLACNPEGTRPVIVGTRKKQCEDVNEAWRELKRGLVKELGNAVYDNWIRSANGQGPEFIAVDNGVGINDPKRGSGLKDLEELIYKRAQHVVANRKRAPVRWLALLEELEQGDKTCVSWNDVKTLTDSFPAFEQDRDKREKDLLNAFWYFSETGRCLLFERGDGLYCVITKPWIAKRAMESQKDLSPEEREITMDLLRKFDLVVQLPDTTRYSPGWKNPIASPAACPTVLSDPTLDNVQPNESEVNIETEFVDFFPLGLLGVVIAHMNITGSFDTPKIKSIEYSDVALMVCVDKARNWRVDMEFDRKRRRVSLTVQAYAKEILSLARRMLRILHKCIKGLPLLCKQTRQKNWLTERCSQEPYGCGGVNSTRFPLTEEWMACMRSDEKDVLPYDLKGRCECRSEWNLVDLRADLVRTNDYSNPILQSAGIGFDCFLSFSGSDAEKIALPFRDFLQYGTLDVYVDNEESRPDTIGTKRHLLKVMSTCKIAVFILSPEFVSRRWPILELKEMIRLRNGPGSSGEDVPKIFPFYKLTKARCGQPEVLLEERKDVFEDSGFFSSDRQRECSKEEWARLVYEMSLYDGPSHAQTDGESVQEFTQRAAIQLMGELMKAKGTSKVGD